MAVPPEALQLPAESAVGERVVVREGKSHWQVDDGQYVLGLDVSMENGLLRVIERKEEKEEREESAPASAETQQDLFARALELESTDPGAAAKAYERAVETDGDDPAAWTNWGRLMHERGELREAEIIYRKALEACGADALLLFNLGVLLEDLERTDEALEAYQASLEEDPTFADCHFNLARLYDVLGKEQHAIRHLGQYRRLLSGARS